MDNGKQYEVLEASVTQGTNTYKITASDENSLIVKTLGHFKKQSDSVIICNDIPYFRNGGTNLEYSLKLVGFTADGRYATRAAASAICGVKGHGKSSKYTDFISEGESNENGEIKLTAPTANDVQTVTIIMGEDTFTIPELTISNSGDYMGTVALVDKDQYNLKITGSINDDQKDNGYLYGNNAKSYEMEIAITNISDNKCSASGCIIESADSKLTVTSSEYNLGGVTISTLQKGATKKIHVSVSYGEITAPYVDTGITVTISNPLTNQEWVDYIPLRFFKGTIPVTISAKSPEKNDNAALNGFIIFPDGNSQFFAIQNNSSKSIFVPTFGSQELYKLVFCGATVSAELSESTEMYYTVEPASIKARTVVTDGIDAIKQYIPFGGNNHTEENAFAVTEGFEAYLNEGEIDYYNLTADSKEFYSPTGSAFWSVSYENEKGAAPSSIMIPDGGRLTVEQLPVLESDTFAFGGWYIGETKVTPDSFVVKGTTILTAKWLPRCTITYKTERGTVPSSAVAGQTDVITEVLLPNIEVEGWLLEGWYDGETLVEAGKYVVKGDTTFTAKWKLECYTIAYYLNGGNNSSLNPTSYTIETKNIVLEAPVKSYYEFDGWFKDAMFEGDKVTEIGGGTTEKLILYAKWKPVVYTINYELNGGINASSNPSSYTIETDTITLADPQKEDYVFRGWFTQEDFSGTQQTEIEKGSYDSRTYYAKWLKKCTVNFVSEHGSLPENLIFGEGECLEFSQIPRVSEKGWSFKGWFTDSNYEDENKVTKNFTVNANIVLYAKWESYISPVLTESVTILPIGTDGTAGTSATYVLFGDWPQTIKADDVTVDESVSEEFGMFTYNLGSDGYWYVKCEENGDDFGANTLHKYSNGVTVSKASANSTKYFKVEPIKWRVLTENYNSSGNALLLAEDILIANIPYYEGSKRTINSSTVYRNNYKYSTIRAYLNGTYENDDTQIEIYKGKGFLQTAFIAESQNLIATTTVDNSAESTTDSDNKISLATNYACVNTSDKIFLLSEKEVTTSNFGFDSVHSYGTGNTRIKKPTDFAKANNAYKYVRNDFSFWWLRSPIYYIDFGVYIVCYDGGTIYRDGQCGFPYVYCKDYGVVPALTISLQ